MARAGRRTSVLDTEHHVHTLTHRDVTVPRIGIGTWELTDGAAYDSVRDALDLGYRHVDTAQAYGNEEEVGRAIADSGVDRDDLFVTTKVWMEHAAPVDVERTTGESLRRLGLDHVDLLLIHWPTDVAPIEATVEALADQQTRDRTRLIGVSNYTAAQFQRAAKVADVATNQVEYHALLSQDTVLNAVRSENAFLTAYSPLAHGALLDDDRVEKVAADVGASVAQVALAWLLAQDDVVALPRSSSRDHIEDNIAAQDLTLTEEHLQTLDELPKDQRQIDPPFAPDWD